MRLFSATLLSATLLSAAAFADSYEFDREHTNVLFFVSHIGFSEMVGRVTKVDGTFTFDPQKPEESTLDLTIKPGDIKTSSETLDKGLQGEKFFNTAKFPTIHFVSKKVTVTAAGGSGNLKDQGDIIGDLTMLGVTKPVTLHVTYNKSGYHPLTGKYVSGFSATARIKRSDFGMNAYIPQVGDDVRFEIQAEGNSTDPSKQPRIH